MFLTDGFKNKTNCGKLIRGETGETRETSSPELVRSLFSPSKRPLRAVEYLRNELKKNVRSRRARWRNEWQRFTRDRESAIEVYRRRTDEETSKKVSRERKRSEQRKKRETRKKNLSTVNFIRNSLSPCLSPTSSLAFVHDLSFCLFVVLSGTNVFLSFPAPWPGCNLPDCTWDEEKRGKRSCATKKVNLADESSC